MTKKNNYEIFTSIYIFSLKLKYIQILVIKYNYLQYKNKRLTIYNKRQ